MGSGKKPDRFKKLANLKKASGFAGLPEIQVDGPVIGSGWWLDLSCSGLMWLGWLIRVEDPAQGN